LSLRSQAESLDIWRAQGGVTPPGMRSRNHCGMGRRTYDDHGPYKPIVQLRLSVLSSFMPTARHSVSQNPYTCVMGISTLGSAVY
ncbi:hypothetical protein L9F63_007177, partial [Diploptera punctata]